MVTERDVLAGQAVDQGLIDGMPPVGANERALAEYRARKEGRRGNAPLPVGGLFDEVERAQQEMF